MRSAKIDLGDKHYDVHDTAQACLYYRETTLQEKKGPLSKLCKLEVNCQICLEKN